MRFNRIRNTEFWYPRGEVDGIGIAAAASVAANGQSPEALDIKRQRSEERVGDRIEDMIAEGDKVVCKNVWRWTDKAGKRMAFHGFVLWRFEGDKIAERWATVTKPAEDSSWD